MTFVAEWNDTEFKTVFVVTPTILVWLNRIQPNEKCVYCGIDATDIAQVSKVISLGQDSRCFLSLAGLIFVWVLVCRIARAILQICLPLFMSFNFINSLVYSMAEEI